GRDGQLDHVAGADGIFVALAAARPAGEDLLEPADVLGLRRRRGARQLVGGGADGAAAIRDGGGRAAWSRLRSGTAAGGDDGRDGARPDASPEASAPGSPARRLHLHSPERLLAAAWSAPGASFFAAAVGTKMGGSLH